MKIAAARATASLALAALVIGVGAMPASADTWTGDDPAGDVSEYSYVPEPAPCGTFTEAVVPTDGATDIVSLTARHRRDTVELTARFRDLTRVGSHSVSFEIQTDGRAWEVEVRRHRSGGAVRVNRFAASEPPTSVDECGIYMELKIGRDCPGLTAKMAARDDLVSVVVPRTCLGKPRWIRAGVRTVRFLESSGRDDVWDPEGSETLFTGPFSPKLRRG